MSVLSFGSILLPKTGIDLNKWAVVACDQFTSQPEYWQELDNYIGDAPSTLRVICPEAFLSEAATRLPEIHAKAEEYVKSVLSEVKGAVLVKRTTESGVRWGIMCLADLEEYNYTAGNKAKIRATEGTVIERIPPRLEVRKASRLDLPHVLCLIDDKDDEVIKPLIGQGRLLYDFDLNAGGGAMSGWLIENTSGILDGLSKLEQTAQKQNKPFVLVGDGNHSLASAKALYEYYKSTGDKRADKARYALVEVENLRSDGIIFEPIHRIISDTSVFDLLKSTFTQGKATTVFVGGESQTIYLPEDPVEAYKAVQSCLDEYSQSHSAKIDYIHGADSLRGLCFKNNAVGIVMPALDKNFFFDYVEKFGSLPRKTFSMGEANEKRYYMECRDID